jgi:hypothetical protein
MTALSVNVAEVTQTLTLKVRGQKTLAVRMWLCTLLLRMAGAALGTKLSVDLSSGDDFDERDLPPAFDGEAFRRYIKVGEYTVPTACSVREGSPLYESSFHTWGRHVDVWLDGVKQDRVVSFDMDHGWLRRFKTDAEGEAQIEGDEFATEILRGEIELRPA